MSQPSWIGYELGGRYRIDAELGQGGMASVYKATDPNLRRVVAIKLIHNHLSNNPEFVRRFEEEAAAVAQLSHQNIVKVFDYNHDNDTYFMVLEFLAGETLQDTLKRLNNQDRRMSVDDVVQYGAGICDAIDYAHRRGMLHRDIKPANIMLNTEGQAILMDFGVVKMMGGEQHTATGAVIGTAMYMSPEQARGERPDERADIYALGVTLFEMVSGRRPYQADSVMTVMMMHVNDPIPNIQEVNPDAPLALRQIIEKAMAKNPKARYQSASELAAALRGMSSMPAVDPAGTMLDTASMDDFGATMIEPPAAPRPEATLMETASPEVTSRPPVMAPPPEPPSRPPAAKPSQRGGSRLPVFALLGIGALGLVVLLGLLGIFVLPGLLGGGGDDTPVSEVTQISSEESVVVVPTEAQAPTDLPPTETLVPTEPPTATPFPEPFVEIQSITLNGTTYMVNYETYGYTEALPGMHIHFFFDTVSVDQAGLPGSGPWQVWGGPRPFTGYSTANRPATATQMCALVANSDHSIQPATGNCVILPE